MKLLAKTKSFQESFYNLQRMPTYMPANHKCDWFLTDTVEAYEAAKARGLSTYSKNDVKYEFNSHGYRSIEFKHYPNAINILILGESNSIGVGLPFDHIWFNTLAERLKKEEGLDHVNFLNLSVSSATLDYMAMSLNQAYDLLKPDYVIVLGGTFFGSLYYMSEDQAKSKEFITFPFGSEYNPPSGKITPDKTFIPPEYHHISKEFTRDMNLANCFFKSFMSYSFIKRICNKEFLIYFRNPKVYEVDLPQEISQYDSEFFNHYLNFNTYIISPTSCDAPHFARDGIHVGKQNHDQIADFILSKLKLNGTLEKWKLKFANS